MVVMSTPVKVARGPDQIICLHGLLGIPLSDRFAGLRLLISASFEVAPYAPPCGKGPLVTSSRLTGALPPDRSDPCGQMVPVIFQLRARQLDPGSSVP